VRAASFLALVLGVLLLAGGVAFGVRERSQKQLAVDHRLTNKVDEEAGQLAEYFERSRSISLLSAHNPAFRDFYNEPGERLAKVKARGPALRRADEALAYLEELYPQSIGEACFIDAAGPENGRYVFGVRASLADLSPDESGAAFFKPTFALRAGQVYQAKPYVSPDTHEWVISNSTPVPGTGYPAKAIVHFEITVESFRREAAEIAGGHDVVIADSATGEVIVDSRFAQKTRAPLGRPDDHRFLALAGAEAGTRTIAGQRSAFRRLNATAHNVNDWLVVAIDPHPTASLTGGFGAAPLGTAAAGLLLLLLSGISFRASRKALHTAAHTDALTGLGNRRKLIEDLESHCERAGRGERFGLVLFDLDGFKNYNDSFGHLPGDTLLRRLAQKLDESISGWGTAYRLGGDEFCLLAPLRGQEPAEGIALLGAQALQEEGEGFLIGASYGAVALPDEAHAPSDALGVADLRMYAYKHKGRPSTAQQTTDALVRVQYERSPLLGPHVSDVAKLAVATGERLGLPEHRLHWLRQTAELHDVGKMAIPDDVLNKPGSLTEDEWQLVQEHTIVGERIVSAAPALREVAKIVRATHERYDGHGYPDRLAGEEIPLEARIVNAADALSAMTTTRPYREALSQASAIEELKRCAGTQFDPVVVDALASLLHESATARRDARDPVGLDR
jgi:diguanylate cyclase (GGDEF)-like protein